MRAIVRGPRCATYPRRMDVGAIWRRYGRHAATVLRAGPALTTTASAGSFTAFSGAPHVGFVVIDDVEAWTLGASDQDMDAVGAG